MKSEFMPAQHAARFGWAYGRIAALAPDLATPERYSHAVRLPMEGFGTLHNLAMERGLVSGDAQKELASALAGIPAEDLPTDAAGNSAFALGYYRGLAGKPLTEPPFNIAEARKQRGLTQRQLADALGILQPQLAAWETGKRNPRPATLAKIREILS